MTDIADIERARAAVYEVARRTPLLPADRLSRDLGADVRLKAECLQYTGSFKVRGATNRLSALTAAERARGVIAASAGNHAQGVAVAAARLGVVSTVVMPAGAALAKVQAAKRYGARVVLHGEDYDDAVKEAHERAAPDGPVFIPGFDDERIIAGQGTLGLELLEDCPDAATVIVPVGGGGLIAGVATAVKSRRTEAKVIGVQASAATAMAQSFRGGTLVATDPGRTIADGIAVGAPGALPFEHIRRYVDDIVVVEEETIAQAIVLMLEEAKLVVEGAGAVGVAALISGAVRAGTGPAVVVLSGGNIDINTLDQIVQRGLLHENRYLTLHADIDDRPGSLAQLLALVSETGANVIDVDHIRQAPELPLGGVKVRLLLETRDREHVEEVTARVAGAGYTLTGSGPTSRSFRPRAWK
jgi:threonine dehydratase